MGWRSLRVDSRARVRQLAVVVSCNHRALFYEFGVTPRNVGHVECVGVAPHHEDQPAQFLCKEAARKLDFVTNSSLL